MFAPYFRFRMLMTGSKAGILGEITGNQMAVIACRRMMAIKNKELIVLNQSAGP